jgi:hypothetical protein
MKRFLTCFCCIAIITVESNRVPACAQPSAKPKEKQVESSDIKKAAEFLRARIAFVGFLNSAYQKRGYRLRVEANGPEKRTLELSSGFMWEGSQTMEAALEVLEDAGVYANVKNCRFTKVIFAGNDFSIAYSIAAGRAQRIK